ncbi:T9SS type A sorting domain-containing protein [Bacteroidales bacterium OttesenSCG-928-K03]|nr:T9SS type A sorting domain-containing protein [Odoribacter sp. OttesenSCG-928-L07]MDL2238648.1 T9SS type A sorting domain-containing protein [Bacteroidales bacterium OttesenSCG-928-L14]MDL2240283.1 T9SS type A sorting domain-containing protein [Bacteroidales bacterium OttesenSCG-928-K22]MDL2242700.1 T9SS type A sorting domain-containing protein [Bacteroidales bacterium OttesenSCG-928-K03]
MKNIFTVFCTLLIAFSLFSQDKAFTPTLVTPTTESNDLMPIVLLDWEPVAGYLDLKYEVQISDDESFNNISYTLNTDLSAIYTPPLKFNTEYFWRVRAIDNNNASSWSDVWSYKTFSTIRATGPNESQLQTPRTTLSWSNIATLPFKGISKFEILISDSETFEPTAEELYTVFVEENIEGVKTMNTIIYTLNFNTKYYWKIRAYNSAEGAFEDVSDWTDTRAFITVGLNELSKPEMRNNRNLNLQPDVSLLAKNTYTGCQYIFEIDTDEEFSNPSEYKSVTPTLSNYDTLLFGEKYFWRSRLEYNDNLSDWTEETWWFTVIASPEIESPANGEIMTPTKKLNVKKINCTDNYVIEVSSSSNFTSDVYTTIVDQPKTKVEVSLNSFVGFAPEENKTYYWRVKAVNDKNESDWTERNFKYTTVGIQNYIAVETNIYPNPNTGSFNIEVESSIDDATIRIFDLTGRIRYNNTVNLVENTPYYIDTNLSKGLYIIEINNNNGIRTNKKFTVQ